MKPFGSGIKIPEGAAWPTTTLERHIKKIRNRIRASKRKAKILKIFIK